MKKAFILNIYSFFIIVFCLTTVIAEEIEIISDYPGTGPKIENHYKVSVHYKGFLEDGTEFDSSFKRNQPFIFQIGLRQVIAGWDIGLMSMRVGGKRTLRIPSELAYGEKGAGDLIPANATLIFDVEILKVQPPGYKLIEGDELIAMQEDGLIVIDIRTKKEWKKTGTIKKSKKITAFNKAGNFEPLFLKSFQKIANTSTKVVFVGKDGDISSILANGFVEKLGYRNMYSLKGGIEKWIKLGNPLK